eukprot:TRINITY_DN7713_c0_g1_i2.p1 TRINITY_DN7713_c0_g1~~TRINITY_DN7713_c0_g1_i2.p1  ORF type:complete len:356 (+),score=103.95 TRINITY_DN7713_c0_g1_i2:103-1170(+)
MSDKVDEEGNVSQTDSEGSNGSLSDESPQADVKTTAVTSNGAGNNSEAFAENPPVRGSAWNDAKEGAFGVFPAGFDNKFVNPTEPHTNNLPLQTQQPENQLQSQSQPQESKDKTKKSPKNKKGNSSQSPVQENASSTKIGMKRSAEEMNSMHQPKTPSPKASPSTRGKKNNQATAPTSPPTGAPNSANDDDEDANSKKRRGNLPKSATNLLKAWLFNHIFHPYPTEEEKGTLSVQTGLSINQISNWFINARRRILQPMLESARSKHDGPGDLAQMMASPPMPQAKHGGKPIDGVKQPPVQPPQQNPNMDQFRGYASYPYGPMGGYQPMPSMPSYMLHPQAMHQMPHGMYINPGTR